MAMWFIDATAEPNLVGCWLAMPGAAGSASANHMNASEAPLPMSKKKCCPPGPICTVLNSGKPSSPS